MKREVQTNDTTVTVVGTGVGTGKPIGLVRGENGVLKPVYLIEIGTLKKGDRFKRNNGKQRAFTVNREFGNPKPVKRADGGLDFLATVDVKTTSGRTFDIVRTEKVIPL